MKKNKTEIVLVLDRSGSMASIKTDMEGGLKAFIEDQKKLPGEAYVTLYQFDTQFEKVYALKNIQEINEVVITPRGSTALLDAIGMATREVGDRLNFTPEDDKPGLVQVIIITDGQENSSAEYTKDKIQAIIKEQQEVYNWKFTFLGANMDAVAVGQSYGLAVGDTITYGLTKGSITGMAGALSMKSRAYRLGGDYAFSDKDREAANQK